MWPVSEMVIEIQAALVRNQKAKGDILGFVGVAEVATVAVASDGVLVENVVAVVVIDDELDHKDHKVHIHV